MGIVEVSNLPRFMIWQDGFLPSRKVLEDVVSPGIKEKLRSGSFEIDDLYAIALEKNIAARVTSATGAGDLGQADIYVIRPRETEVFPDQYLPIHTERAALGSKKADYYRLCCMILSEKEPNMYRDSFLESLRDLRFENKPENSYISWQNLRRFLADLSEVMVTPYYAPSIAAESSLNKLGLDAETGTVI